MKRTTALYAVTAIAALSFAGQAFARGGSMGGGGQSHGSTGGTHQMDSSMPAAADYGMQQRTMQGNGAAAGSGQQAMKQGGSGTSAGHQTGQTHASGTGATTKHQHVAASTK